MSNLYIEFYHKYVCIGKSIVQIGFRAILSFRQPLGVLERLSHDKEGTTVYSMGHEYAKKDNFDETIDKFAEVRLKNRSHEFIYSCDRPIFPLFL